MPHFGGKNAKKKSSSTTTKRNFTVVIGSKEHGLYVSSSPSSAARKAVSKLCATDKKRKVSFHIREITQKSEKKTYGPYLGYIEKLAKPIELKGRIIRYKPVAKLSGKTGKKTAVKKGGMRGGKSLNDFFAFSLLPEQKIRINDGKKSNIPDDTSVNNAINQMKENINPKILQNEMNNYKFESAYFGKPILVDNQNTTNYYFPYFISSLKKPEDENPIITLSELKSNKSITNTTEIKKELKEALIKLKEFIEQNGNPEFCKKIYDYIISLE